MPLVAHRYLPAFNRLKEEGQLVLQPEWAMHQDIRELHVGLLNMMPDAALIATERQFFRLVGASNSIAQFHMHPFTLPSIQRGEQAQQYIEQYYEHFADIREQGLDALIISGAVPAQEQLSTAPFWQELTEVLDWANDSVTSVMCSCLATHVVTEYLFNTPRQRVEGGKCWGVFSHTLLTRDHPLVSNMNTRFDAPHSHVYEVTREALEQVGIRVLVESEQAGVHVAVSPDQFRWVFSQGHPEYDRISLVKEYKREVMRWYAAERSDYPVLPHNMLDSEEAVRILDDYASQVAVAKLQGSALPEFPESRFLSSVHNTWTDTAKVLFSNWLGKIYQLTHHERSKPFMDDIDPNDPLGLLGD